MAKDGPSIVSNSTAATFGNSPQKTGEPIDRLNIYSGKALEFDGVGDYLDTGSNQTYALTNNGFTLSMWIYPDDITTTQTYLTYATSNDRIYFNSNAGQMGIQIDGKGGTTPTFTPTFAAGQWYKFDLVYKAGIIYIYNNGVAVSFSSPAEDFWDQTGDGLATEYIHRYIGFYSVAGKLNSKISNYQIWNIAWEASDVQYAYNNPEKLITDNPSVTSGITTSNLKLWYPMNDTGITNPQTVVFDGANTGGLETNLVTGVGTSGNWNNLTTADLTNGSATGFTLTSNADGSSNAYFSGSSGILSQNFTAGYYRISLDVTQTTPFGDEQSIRWYKTGSSVESLSLTAGSNLFYRSIDTANNNSQFFFNSNGAGNDITVSNFSIQKVKQPLNATTTFLGDNIFESDAADGSDASYWTSGGNSGVAVDSGAIKITNDSNTKITFSDSASLTEDLVIGKQYRLSADLKVNSGSNVNWYISGPNVFLADGFTATDFTTTTVDFTATHATNNHLKVTAMASGEEAFIDNLSLKEIGIATGWTDADQQQYIPQTALMDGCIKTIFNEPDDNNERVDLAWGNGVNTQNYSYSSWVFPISGNGMFMTPSSFGTNQRLYMALTSSKWDLGIGSKSWETTPDSGSLPSATLNAWAHYTLVVNDTQGIVYINGTEAFRRTPTTTSFTLPADMDLMASANNYVFGGMIDEVSIFNTALSDTQVLALYNNGLPLNATKSTAASNLVGYWRNNVLTSTGSWKDLTDNGNHGTVTGSPSGSIFFQQGATANLCTQGYSNNIVHPSKGSMHFLGQEYAAFPGERIINLDGDFTIEFWAKKTQLHPGGLTDNMLFGSGSNQIRIPDGVGSGKMANINYRDAGVNSSLSIHSDNRKSLYEWFHVAIVKEQGTIKPYIDTVGTGNGTLSSTGQMQIKLIGAYSVALNYMYKGFLDDLRIYDKALSAAEITKNYKNTKSQHKNS